MELDMLILVIAILVLGYFGFQMMSDNQSKNYKDFRNYRGSYEDRNYYEDRDYRGSYDDRKYYRDSYEDRDSYEERENRNYYDDRENRNYHDDRENRYHYDDREQRDLYEDDGNYKKSHIDRKVNNRYKNEKKHKKRVKNHPEVEYGDNYNQNKVRYENISDMNEEDSNWEEEQIRNELYRPNSREKNYKSNIKKGKSDIKKRVEFNGNDESKIIEVQPQSEMKIMLDEERSLNSIDNTLSDVESILSK